MIFIDPPMPEACYELIVLADEGACLSPAPSLSNTSPGVKIAPCAIRPGYGLWTNRYSDVIDPMS
jgi:hypothetical protein